MAQISNQFAHIFIHYYSNKTASACKLFISEPTQNQERLLGRIFGILEINTPSRENYQLINYLITNLEQTYYAYAEAENLDVSDCFEKTLKEVNENFIQIIRDKQISMVGNLNENTIREKINLAIGVMKDNQLYLSYLNNINISLIHKTKQDYKTIDIKKIAQEENDTPKTAETSSLFGNILSGEVNPPDFLILANANFSQHIFQERIQKILTSLPLHKATEYFKNSLLQFEGQNFAAIFIKKSLSTAETDVKTPASLSSITELNYMESKTEKLLAPSLWNIIKSAKDLTYKYFLKLKRDTPKQPMIQTKAVQATAETNNESHLKKTKSENLKNFYLAVKKPLKKFYYNSKILNNLKNKLNLKLSILRNKIRTVPNISKILLIIAGILLVLFVFSIFYFKQQQKQTISEQQYQGLIAQIEDKKNQAESNLIYGNEDMAKAEVAEAQNLLATLPVNSKKDKEILDNLNQEIWQIIAKLRHITIIEQPVLVTDLNNQAETPLSIQNIIYQPGTILAFDSSNNTNFAVNLTNQEVTKNPTNLNDIGAIVRVKQIEDRIIAYHNKNGFVEFKNNTYAPILVATAPNSSLADFVTYNSRLYSLDLANNQIYRQPKADNGYSLGVTWLKQAEDLKDITAMAIDTSIWLLDKKGAVFKYTKGTKQNFEVQNLDPVLEAPTRLFTNNQSDYIYIMEPQNKRIVVLDKAGKIVIQYYNDQFNNLQDFNVNETEKKIYLSNDNKIYSFDLSHLN